jgi:hypothetical protein
MPGCVIRMKVMAPKRALETPNMSEQQSNSFLSKKKFFSKPSLLRPRQQHSGRTIPSSSQGLGFDPRPPDAGTGVENGAKKAQNLNLILLFYPLL